MVYGGLSVFPYMWLWNNLSIGPLDPYVTGAIALFGTDLGYYSFHSACHTSNILWYAGLAS
jgi:sterol desaturase/sphingolipid hydroxylase (fatty acid hydroxylase superfamily)